MIVVYDIETIAGIFTYTALDVNTQQIYQFVIHPLRNDLEGLKSHLMSLKGQIGFNNIDFDYQIIHFILKTYDFLILQEHEKIIEIIYKRAQEIISAQNNEEKYKNSVKQKDWIIPQLDLFKLWHYNNKARSTSLKSLEISMNYPNVMDMPISHNKKDIKELEIQEILDYNLNDVEATYEFYKRSKEKIDLRKQLQATYNIPCINFSDSKIGEQLTLKLYCEKTGKDFWKVKELRTYRPKIVIKDCIFDYVKFQSKEFNDFLDRLKEKVVSSTKGAMDDSVIYKGVKYDFGSGGLHFCITPGVYEADSEYYIIDLDVSSLYPSIAVENRLFPAHLGENFCDVYENILQQRIKAKNEGNVVISDGLKLSLNSVYGKSNDLHSFLYDPKYTLQTTINGQLLLTLLSESLVDNITDITILQINTDGITIKINKNSINKYYDLCKEWEKSTNLVLEYKYYKKMIIRDVNNYLALDEKNKIKNKGCFEVDKVVGNEIAYHKDNSFKIIPIALQEYFINNIPIEKTIKNHTNIYDFCGRIKFTKDSYGETHQLINSKDEVIKQQKNVRYYISKLGCTFIKQYLKGSDEVINKGYSITIFNKFIEKENYNIDYSFYIMECNKIIDVVLDKQLQLF